MTEKEVAAAEYLAIYCSMPLTVNAYKEGLMLCLRPHIENRIIVTSDRVGEDAMKSVLGKGSLPIVCWKTRLAKLLMIKAHRSDTDLDHRAAQATLVRSRKWE